MKKKMLDISGKLKLLILLAFFQNNFSENGLKDIYMINPEWSMQYGYKNIQKLIDEKYEEIEN